MKSTHDLYEHIFMQLVTSVFQNQLLDMINETQLKPVTCVDSLFEECFNSVA